LPKIIVLVGIVIQAIYQRGYKTIYIKLAKGMILFSNNCQFSNKNYNQDYKALHLSKTYKKWKVWLKIIV
jgi:hypothetical protein